MLTRAEALDLAMRNVSKRNVIYHMIAVEAIMKALARNLGEDEEKWALVGLLHDIDYEKTENTPERHGLLAEGILDGQVEPEVVRAIKTHNFENTGIKVSMNRDTHTRAKDLRTENFTRRNLSNECHASAKKNTSRIETIAAMK